MTMTAEDVAHYREHGWMCPIDVMSENDATALAAELEAAEAAYPADLHAEHRNNAHLAFPFLAELALHDRVVDAAAALVGDDIGLWSSVLFIKEPMSGSFVSWHQDATYMALEPDNFVTAWIALTPSTANSGCVSVIPGSHTNGRAPHTDTFADDNILTRGQEVADIDESAAVNLELRPGQMSLHHPWLIHGSVPNRTSSRRVGVAMQSYFGGDVRPTSGEHHVMHVRGAPIADPFVTAPRPETVADDASRETRRRANIAISEVLYAGAETRRKL